MTDILIAAAGIALVMTTLWTALQYFRLQAELERRAVTLFDAWRSAELNQVRRHESRLAESSARLMLEEWKAAFETEIRRDAVRKSDSVSVGKITEHFVPYLPEFGFNPRDARFIGSPIDFVVFDGLSEGDLRSVYFVEVKTGRGQLSTRERRVRDAVVAGKVVWKEVRPELPLTSGNEAAASG